MLLKELIKDLPNKDKKIKIRGLSTSSKKVKKGFIFFAIKGNKFNGENYINEAVKKGASVIICSKNCKYSKKNLIIKKTSDIRFLLSKICSKFYNLKPKNIFAVTGTNGKTSVADLFYQILKLNNIPVASIGTLGIKINGKIINSNITSPDPITLHKTLLKLKRRKIENVIIEASSHGLYQKRVEHINFKAGIFTNFSQDHLDYHKNMKSYLNAKLHLFKNILSEKKLIITDKDLKEYPKLKIISNKRNLRLVDISATRTKLKKFLKNKPNDYQLKNLSMAIIAAKACNIDENKIFKSLKNIKDVSGRFELVRKFKNNIKVYIDFAHTPDALEKTLKAIKLRYPKKNVSLVFGCGGDRDFKKRPLMASIANTHCDKIYVTDDNPRNENPQKIRKQILQNIKNTKSFDIGNREKAIKLSILNAEPNEIILVAGKGHESEQIYKYKKIFISDKQIVKKFNLNLKRISNKDQTFLQNKKIIRTINKNFKVKNFHGLAIDSRVIKKGNLFLTIRGKKNNGINFVPKALKKGAKYIISSKNLKKYKNKFLKVENETRFLNKYAELKRDNTRSKIIAITGSAGKTSLKNLIKDLLDNFGDTLCSPKSYNNHYGVPLSLSQLKTSHEFGVFEVGMSNAGEINALTKIIRPHLGIITNIGEAHIENFKNIKGIAEAKSEILRNIEEGGTIILNRDDIFFNFLKKKAKKRNLNLVSFGLTKNSDVYPLNFSKNKINKKLTIKIKNQILKLENNNLNIYNILSSLAVLKSLNLNLDSISKYFKNLELTEGRGKIYKIKRYNKKFNLIDESYNANPLSVKNAIQNFNSIKKQKFKKYLILGDMLELGKKSESLHKDLSKVINNSDIDKVFIKGSKTLITYKNIDKAKRGNIFQRDEDIDFTLNTIIANNDYLMIKGSNATGLNNISKKIIKGF